MERTLSEDMLKIVDRVATYFAKRDYRRFRERDDYFQIAALETLKALDRGRSITSSFLINRVCDALRVGDGRKRSTRRVTRSRTFSTLDFGSDDDVAYFQNALATTDREFDVVNAKLEVEFFLSRLRLRFGDRNASIFKRVVIDGELMKNAGAEIGISESRVSQIVRSALGAF